MEPDDDPWLALDKLQHFILCFCLTVVFSVLAARSRYAFLRNQNISLGSFLSLSIGAAKEAADHLGYFNSAGASFRDAVSDAIGVVIACFLLLLLRLLPVRAKSGPVERIRGSEMV